MVIILNRLKLLREEQNLKQEDIANLLHVEIAAISKYETGRVPLKEEYIKILSNFFDVSSDYLLGLTDMRITHETGNIEVTEEMVQKELERRGLLDTLNVGLSREEEGLLTQEDKDRIIEFAQFVANKRKQSKEEK